MLAGAICSGSQVSQVEPGRVASAVRNQLLVVFEGKVIVGSGGRRADSAIARDDPLIHGRKRVRGTVVVAMESASDGRVARIAMVYQSAGENGRSGRHRMAEPIGPGAIVGDPAERGNHRWPCAMSPFLIAAAAS